MVLPPIQERRLHPRIPVAAGLRIYHPVAGREFPARAMDISPGGMCLRLPATAPVKEGQDLRLMQFNDEILGRFLSHDTTVAATVVRVDRTDVPRLGQVVLGVKFA